jgi:hypothetical protein
MRQIVLIGIGAGAAAALLFASLASGSLLALILFYLSPLPLLIAGIGWGNLAGLIAGAFAVLCVSLLFDVPHVLVFVVGGALPAFWLSHLALLARPGDGSSQDKLEWYPTGRIVLWAAAMASLGTLVGLAVAVSALGLDVQNLHGQLKSLFDATEERIRTENNLGPEKLFNSELLASIVPGIAAGLSTLILLLNTSLAARIVRVSGQLRRPWPALAAMTFPRAALLVLAVACAGILLLPGLPGLLATIVAGAFIMAFVVLGFAVLHAMTRGFGGRPLVLVVTYVAVIIFAWPALLVAMLGLIDTAIDLRVRVALTRGPPTAPPQ